MLCYVNVVLFCGHKNKYLVKFEMEIDNSTRWILKNGIESKKKAKEKWNQQYHTFRPSTDFTKIVPNQQERLPRVPN